MNPVLQKINIDNLAKKLNKYECVRRFDSIDEPEAWRIAHSLCDLVDSFNDIRETYLPALNDADDEKSVNDILLDIGDELRHILYHIKDPRFFSYLMEDICGDTTEDNEDKAENKGA
jgi:hypothetical protein